LAAPVLEGAVRTEAAFQGTDSGRQPVEFRLCGQARAPEQAGHGSQLLRNCPVVPPLPFPQGSPIEFGENLAVAPMEAETCGIKDSREDHESVCPTGQPGSR
jgi:hypothetical protein